MKLRQALWGVDRKSRASGVALGMLYLFTGVTLLGYATFGLHPELLARFPQVAGLYAPAFRFFALGHTWLAWGVLTLFLILHVRWRWVVAFAVLYLLSLGSELLGTIYGIPFGEYRYSGLLAPMWLGLVPVVIPLSWFFMALPAYALARSVLPARQGPLLAILLGSLLLLSWDLSLDPAMSYATPYWIWGDSGPYYGMPWLNLFGWYVTGVILMGALAALGAESWIRELPLPWLAGFYLANLLLPLGMNLAAGLWGAVAATLAALGVAVGLLRVASRTSQVSGAVPVRVR